MPTKWEYFDRHGVPLVAGQDVTVQHCVGRYGKVAQVTGTLRMIGDIGDVYVDTGKQGEGNCMYPGFTPDRSIANNALRGYAKFDDFEHGHEKWIEIIAAPDHKA